MAIADTFGIMPSLASPLAAAVAICLVLSTDPAHAEEPAPSDENTRLLIGGIVMSSLGVTSGVLGTGLFVVGLQNDNPLPGNIGVTMLVVGGVSLLIGVPITIAAGIDYEPAPADDVSTADLRVPQLGLTF